MTGEVLCIVRVGSLCNRDNDSELFNARRHCKNATNDDINYVQCKADRCPANNWIVGFLLTLYALFMIIMLLNILIAMFKYVKITFSLHTLRYVRVSLCFLMSIVCWGL